MDTPLETEKGFTIEYTGVPMLRSLANSGKGFSTQVREVSREGTPFQQPKDLAGLLLFIMARGIDLGGFQILLDSFKHVAVTGVLSVVIRDGDIQIQARVRAFDDTMPPVFERKMGVFYNSLAISTLCWESLELEIELKCELHDL